MKKLLLLFILMSSFIGQVCVAYTYLPIVKSFDKKEYGAGRQNWDVAVDSHGIVYFGNNDGLLRNIFGIWQLSRTTNNDLIRSLCVQNDTIWAAGTSDFGYFVKDTPSDLSYHLVGRMPSGSAWETLCNGNLVFFQTESAILVYNKKEEKTTEVPIKSGFYGLTLWRNKVWTVTREGMIGTIEQNVFKPEHQFAGFKDVEIRKLFVQNKKLHMLMFDGHVYVFDGKDVKQKELPKRIAGKALFSVIPYDDDQYCLGTISDGFVMVNDQNKTIVTNANSDNGLIDNTVLGLQKDQNGNVWLGLDYGIAFVEMQNTVKPIFDQGATYYVKDFKGSTYLATNKGLFYDKNHKSFELYPGSEGQVWKIKEAQGQLYVCHNVGLLRIGSEGIEPLFLDDGVRDFAHFKGTNYSVLSTYREILVAKVVNGRFVIVDSFEEESSSKIMYDDQNECIWAQSGERVLQIKKDAYGALVKTEKTGIVDYFSTENTFVFYDGEQLLNYENDRFSPITKVPLNAIKGNGISALDTDKKGNIVAYVQNGMVKMLVNLYDGSFHSYEKMLSSVEKSIVRNHEFIDLQNGELRIATDRGVVTFNPELDVEQTYIPAPIITKVVVSEDPSQKYEFFYPFMDGGMLTPAGDKDILIHFGVSKSYSDFVEYRYKLWPYDKDWSAWETNVNSKSYTKIGGGKYEFMLACRLNGTILETSSISLEVNKFWYQTKLIYLFYLLIFMACIALTIVVMSKINSIKIKKEQIMHGQEVNKKAIDIKNEQLLQYAEVIGKKNEFLMEVKEGLSRMRNTESKHWEKKILDEVGNEKKNFFFHKLFSELHQDFINRLTEKHPNLTPHDVRILSFIRINLGTREIANLLNISTKSVDINRYRIRKKMDLPHETDLNIYVREL